MSSEVNVSAIELESFAPLNSTAEIIDLMKVLNHEKPVTTKKLPSTPLEEIWAQEGSMISDEECAEWVTKADYGMFFHGDRHIFFTTRGNEILRVVRHAKDHGAPTFARKYILEITGDENSSPEQKAAAGTYALYRQNSGEQVEQKKKRGRLDSGVPYIDFSERVSEGKASLLNWKYGTDDFEFYSREARAELTDEDNDLLRDLQWTHGLVDNVANKFKDFFALNLQELRQRKIDTDHPEVIKYISIKSFRQMEEVEIDVNRASLIDNNFLSRFKLKDFEQKPTQRRVAEGVTIERSDPMSEESNDSENLLSKIFERADEIAASNLKGRPAAGQTSPEKTGVRARIDDEVIDWIKSKNPKVSTHMNSLLRALMEADKGDVEPTPD